MNWYIAMSVVTWMVLGHCLRVAVERCEEMPKGFKYKDTEVLLVAFLTLIMAVLWPLTIPTLVVSAYALRGRQVAQEKRESLDEGEET